MVEPWSYIGFVMGFVFREMNERCSNEYSDSDSTYCVRKEKKNYCLCECVNVCVLVFRKGPLRSVTFNRKNRVIEWTWRKYEETKVLTILTGKTSVNRLIWFVGFHEYATWGGGGVFE